MIYDVVDFILTLEIVWHCSTPLREYSVAHRGDARAHMPRLAEPARDAAAVKHAGSRGPRAYPRRKSIYVRDARTLPGIFCLGAHGEMTESLRARL